VSRRWIVIGSLAAVVLLGATVYSLRVGRATTSDQQSCVPASALPEGLRSQATSSDCVTGFTVLYDGTAVAGTIQGNLALVAAGGAVRALSSGGSGAVTSLAAFPISPDRSRELVMYAVDEGIGVFDPQAPGNISLGITRPLVDGRASQSMTRPRLSPTIDSS
jgi:subtilisin family serine protease